MPEPALEDRRKRVNDAVAVVEHVAARSLVQYLGNVVVDARPSPAAWGTIWDPWQGDVVKPMVPAIEHMAGIQKTYSGPRKFFVVLPRGHDKTGLIGRLANFAVRFSRRPISCACAASSRDQARLLLKSARAEIELNPWLSAHLYPYRNEIRGPGGTLEVLPADARTSSGRKDDLIICDELTFWEKRDLFNVLYSGAEKRPNSVFIVITNAGIRDTWQWELYQEAIRDVDNWHVFSAPKGETLASWMTKQQVDALRRMLPRGHARRVLDNEWIHATETPLLPFELIQSCHGDCLWKGGYPKDKRYAPELYVGVDVGRSKNLTVIWTFELVGDVAWTRDVFAMKNKTFAEQRDAISSRVTKNVVRCHIDKGAIGLQLSEELERMHPGIVYGVQLTQARQGQLAARVKSRFEQSRVRVPDDSTINVDLQQVDEIDTANGIPRIKTNTSDDSHADYFWAMALAEFALPSDHQPQYAGPRGRRSRHTSTVYKGKT